MDKNDYLAAMGIQQWQQKNKVSTQAPVTIADTDDAWPTLTNEAKSCVACTLSRTRTQVVFGAGNHQADLLIVGEAPGANEDKQGEPFVGRAGQLLNNMLKAIGLSRKDIYIANILKCRPPNNRDPKAEEVALCTPFLARQIALLQPRVIFALGRIAAHFLLGSTASLASMRGREFRYRDIPLLVSYHPAYLLRSPREKRKSWQDLQCLRKYL